MSRNLERALDRALSDGSTTVDAAISDLAGLARNLSSAFDPELPDARRERALFLNAIAQRGRPWGIVRNLVVAAAGAFLVVALGLAGRSATPGDVLYPVRQVLGTVGLASPVEEEIESHIARAEALLEEANEDLVADPEASLAAILTAMFELGGAEALLNDYDEAARGRLVAEVARLRVQALSLLKAIDLEAANVGTDDDVIDGADDRGSSSQGTGNDGGAPAEARDDDNGNEGRGNDDDRDRDRDGDSHDGTGNGQGSGPIEDQDDNSGPGSGEEDGQGNDDRSGQGQGHGNQDGEPGQGSGDGKPDKDGNEGGPDKDKSKDKDKDKDNSGSSSELGGPGGGTEPDIDPGEGKNDDKGKGDKDKDGLLEGPRAR